MIGTLKTCLFVKNIFFGWAICCSCYKKETCIHLHFIFKVEGRDVKKSWTAQHDQRHPRDMGGQKGHHFEGTSQMQVKRGCHNTDGPRGCRWLQ